MSADDGSWSEVTSPTSQPKRGAGLAATKTEWESEEASEDVINNLLRVKKLSQRVSSVDSDGLPSMASVDVEDNMSLTSLVSESSDLQRARKMYAELQAMSLESASGSTEVSSVLVIIERQDGFYLSPTFQNIQDLDNYARDFYNEIRALSMDTGGSIENILDNIGASCESLSSLIPQEKRTVRHSHDD